MKLFVFILLLPFFMACSSQKSDKKTRKDDIYSAQIIFEDSIYDFGSLILRDKPYSHTFHLKNTGDVPAVILHVNPSCRCTSVNYNKTPITIGGKDSIQVYFDSKESAIGYFDKVIKVRINSPRTYTLRVKGYVNKVQQ